MGKQYEGNVEVFINKNTKRVNIRPNSEGDFNKENANELYKFMKQVADKTGFDMNLFVPDSAKAEVPVLLASLRFGGKPYLAMLDKRDTSTTTKAISPIEVFKPTK